MEGEAPGVLGTMCLILVTSKNLIFWLPEVRYWEFDRCCVMGIGTGMI